MKLYEYDKFPCGCYLKYYDPKEVDTRIAELEKALREIVERVDTSKQGFTLFNLAGDIRETARRVL